ncbi:Vacuolar amino acid transporter 2 [Diplonema papillatum]|nr:Vacuolar amino acid transporter 2 [Diplonema papillatum]|eukprot:gene19678-30324_t
MGRFETEQQAREQMSVDKAEGTRSSGYKWYWMLFGGKDPTSERVVPMDVEPELGESSQLIEGYPKTKASLLANVFNLCNVCLGAGTLSMPFAFSNVGVLLGLIILTLIYVLMCVSAVMLCEAARKVNPNHTNITYGGIMYHAFGNKGKLIVQIIIVISTAGIGIAYFQLIGDLLSPPIAYWIGDEPADYCNAWTQREVPIYFSLALEFLLCIMPTLNALRHVSMLAVVSMLYLTVIVVVKSGEKWDEKPSDDEDFLTFRLTTSIFRSISIMTFAFAPHIQVVTMFGELDNPTPRRVKTWIWASLTLCWAVYAVVGYFGYRAFYNKVEGNVLLNHEADETEVTIGRIGVAVSVMAGYPMMCAPCVTALDRMFFPRREIDLWGRRIVWVLVFLGFTFGIAILIEDVSIVLGLTGASGLTAAAFLIPAALYIYLYREEHGWFGTALTKWAHVTFALGCFFGSVAIVINLIDAFDGDDDDIECVWSRMCGAQRCCTNTSTYFPDPASPDECPY